MCQHEEQTHDGGLAAVYPRKTRKKGAFDPVEQLETLGRRPNPALGVLLPRQGRRKGPAAGKAARMVMAEVEQALVGLEGPTPSSPLVSYRSLSFLSPSR